jgi:hypothetical protein
MQIAERVCSGSMAATHDFTHDEVDEVSEVGQRMLGLVENELLSAVRGEG